MANATDADGTISKVEFYNGTMLLGTATTSPYSFNWTNVTAGNYSLTAKATDNKNTTTTSAPVNVTVTTIITGACNISAWNATQQYLGASVVSRNGNQYTAKWWTQNEDPVTHSSTYDVWKLNGPCGGGVVNINPTISINAPASIVAPANIVITATAADADGTVTKIDFYYGTILLGTSTASPYKLNWNNVAAGNYTLTAKATDNSAGTTTSAAITVAVTTATNINPVAAITSPTNNTTYNAPASVVINATATDADGTISKVDFYNGATILGTATVSPYTFNWSNVAAGTYTLTVKATDNTGAATTSAPVNITVNPGTDNCANIAQYVSSGANYNAGSIVKNAGKQYQCKPWPYSGWCSIAPSAYAPGTGTNWSDAWILLGDCSTAAIAFTNTASLMPSKPINPNDVTLYPNPGVSGSVVTLFFDSIPGNIQLAVTDRNGTTILTQRYMNVERSLQVLLPLLPSGFYFIRIQNANTVWNKEYMIK
ncbi:MAG: T9SS type A sorting domain-containing protein [Sphingobacteriales bacterium]|nr:T9SS type A sorting domain-containing protein [Sphingobacteriales bacterium]